MRLIDGAIATGGGDVDEADDAPGDAGRGMTRQPGVMSEKAVRDASIRACREGQEQLHNPTNLINNQI